MSKSKHSRPSRYELTQTQWGQIEDLLPGKASDLPPRYGAYKSVHKRFTGWAAKGIWEQVFQSLMRDRSNEYLLIDSSIVRANKQVPRVLALCSCQANPRCCTTAPALCALHSSADPPRLLVRRDLFGGSIMPTDQHRRATT